MDDTTIILKLKNRDEDGYSLLIDRYCAYVSAVVCNLARDRLCLQDIEELCADVFFAVWKNSGSLLPEGSLKPYLAQTARNAVWSRLRKPGEGWIPFDDTILVPATDAPDEETEWREQIELLNRAVEEFGEPERELFVRFYYFGERVRELADRLDLRPSTVKTKLRRCRLRLQAMFQERGYGR